MSKRQTLYLLSGCLFVLALEFPLAMRQVRADWAGPWGTSAPSATGQAQSPEIAKHASPELDVQSHLGSTPIPTLTLGPDQTQAEDLSSEAIVATR